jgi:hypothetical protein
VPKPQSIDDFEGPKVRLASQLPASGIDIATTSFADRHADAQ